MSRNWKIGVVAAAASLILGAASQSLARPAFQEDFRGQTPGIKGSGSVVTKGEGFVYQGPGDENTHKGSWVEYELAGRGFAPGQGTIELDLTRSEKAQEEALVTFADGTGERLVVFAVNWQELDTYNPHAIAFSLESHGPGRSHLVSKTKDDFGITINVPGAYMKGKIPRGRTVHVAMTWGPKDVKVFIDGNEIPAESADVKELGQTLAKATKLIIGAQTSAAEIPGGAWSMSSSLIGNVQIHDRELLPSEFAQAIIPAVPVIAAVNHDAFTATGFSGKLVAGNSLQVSMSGSPAAKATFDVAYLTGLEGTITLDWRGYGVYLENKTFYESGEVNLRDANAYLVYVGKAPIDPAAPGMEPLARLKLQEQSYLVESLEPETVYYVAVVAEMRDGSFVTVFANPTGLPMTETGPGVYAGSYAVGGWDRLPQAVVVGRLSNGAASASLVNPAKISVDAALNLAVAASVTEMKADEMSTSAITVTATDANGNPVAGRKIKFLLATTSQYTGVVGGGAFEEQVGGTIDAGHWGETDLFGKISATYVAGFAAKTAVIVARDMSGNSTGACYVKTFIRSTAQLELEPVVESQAATEGYEITVTSSDEWLTADGSSQARITALVTRAGQPVEGDRVVFAVASGSGTIKAVKDTTDKDGKARAVYTAGKKIGIVLITATDTTVGITGSVQIELRSDAPAKIAVKITPEKLPADGRSRADVLVTVTDINDNPNDNTEVEYMISEGSGNLRLDKGLTDRSGESSNQYTAGRVAGRVSIEITVRSLVPTEAELLAARDLALAVQDYDFF